LNHKELEKRLTEMGIQSLPIATIRRWVHEGLVERPKREPRPPKRGLFGEWPDKSLEDAVATFVVRHSYLWRPPTTEELLKIKEVAEDFQQAPWKHCHIRLHEVPAGPFSDEPSWRLWEGGFSRFATPAINWTEGVVSFSPREQISKWLAAVEKVRQNVPLSDRVYVIYDWIIDWPRNEPGLIYHDRFEYKSKRVLLEPLVPCESEQVWEPEQHYGVPDQVYIFFRAPESQGDPLELVRQPKYREDGRSALLSQTEQDKENVS
jgi:hypothetical protein